MADDELQLSIQDLIENPAPPQTAEDWAVLEGTVRMLFKPRAPIDENRLFAGRISQVRQLLDVIYEHGAHAILYGERGVGKTSLANVIKERIIGPTSKYTTVLKVSCSPGDTFSSIWSNVFFDYTWKGGTEVAEMIRANPEPFTIYKIAESLGRDPIHFHLVILDEFDRVRDADTKTKIADTIKYLSDNPSRLTIVVVGVGNSIQELFGSHPSIRRCCVEIPMPRMSADELRQIITERIPKVGMAVPLGIVDRMVQLSQGLPGYMHLLGQLSALVAVESRTMEINKGCLDAAVSRALHVADESTRRDYYNAIRSTKPDNRYRQVLLACALAHKNALGQFSASDVAEPYSEIMGKRMALTHYARHLNAFCEPARGPALIKSGRKKGFLYQFANPLLEPLVIMSGTGAPT